jgi:hypothetical protein
MKKYRTGMDRLYWQALTAITVPLCSCAPSAGYRIAVHNDTTFMDKPSYASSYIAYNLYAVLLPCIDHDDYESCLSYYDVHIENSGPCADHSGDY